MNKTRKIILIIGSIISLLAVVFLLFLYYDSIAKNFSKDNPNGEFFKVLLTVSGGFAIFYGLYLNSRRIKAQTVQNKIAGDSNSDKRFSDAIGLLNNENEGIVLGGIYVLYQLAKEDHNNRYVSIVSNLLCSYLKQNSESLYSKFEKENKDSDKVPNEAPIIVRTIIDVLFNYDESVFDNERLNLDNLLLKNIIFEKAIKDCNFYSSKLEQCKFNSDVIECNFVRSEIISCNFGDWYKSSIVQCNFSFSKICNCYFGNSRKLTIDHSSFFATEIDNTSFWGINYLYLQFTGRKFNKVRFNVRNIQFCEFYHTEVSVIVFEDVKSFEGTLIKNKEKIIFTNCTEEPQELGVH